MKVRWTTRCAGWCGTYLVVGTSAERRHRSLWCLGCYARHLAGCTRCQETEEDRRTPAVAVPAGQVALF